MKFLLITQHYKPETGSCAIKMDELARYLVEKNHGVTVITGFPYYPHSELYEGYRMELLKREFIDGIEVIRVPLYITSERYNFAKRLLNHLSFMISAIFGGLLANKPDLIYYYSPPLFVGFSAGILGRIFRIPVVGEINDLWPKAPISLGVLKSKFLIKIAKWFESLIYKNSDRLLFYSKTMKDEVVNDGVFKSKTAIYPLWISTEIFSPVTDKKIRKIIEKYNFNNKFLVMYAGYIGTPQGLEVVVDVARELNDYRDICFVFVGGGPEKEKLQNKCNNYELDNIKFIPFQPKEKIPDFLSTADVLFAHLSPAPHRRGTIPGKILAYMSMGKPLVVAAEGESNRMISKIECGIVAEPGNVESISKQIVKLYDNAKLRAKLGKKAREYAVSHFEKKLLLKKLLKELLKTASLKK